LNITLYYETTCKNRDYTLIRLTYYLSDTYPWWTLFLWRNGNHRSRRHKYCRGSKGLFINGHKVG